MRYLTITRFVLLLLVVWQANGRSDAFPNAVKTSPHVFPLHYVSWLNREFVVPRIALKADFVAYPDLPPSKQFLDAPEGSPERVVARYVQVLSSGGATLTVEMQNVAKDFYTKDEQKDLSEIVDELIKSDHSQIQRLSDIRMWHRYDAGPLSTITLAYISPLRVQPFVTLYLRKIGSSYFITTYERAYRGNQGIDPLFQLITLNESRLVRGPNLADVPQPKYSYSFPLHSSLPDDTSTTNPIQILFTGQVSNVLVDEKMVPADATQAFIKRAVQTSRNGTLEQFLALWTDSDVKGIFARTLGMNALLVDDAARALLDINNFGQTLWFNDEGASHLMEVLRETETFEGANWPLEVLDEARGQAEFRVVRWMEEARKSGQTNGSALKTPLDFPASTSI